MMGFNYLFCEHRPQFSGPDFGPQLPLVPIVPFQILQARDPTFPSSNPSSLTADHSPEAKPQKSPPLLPCPCLPMSPHSTVSSSVKFPPCVPLQWQHPNESITSATLHPEHLLPVFRYLSLPFHPCQVFSAPVVRILSPSLC